MPSLPPRRWYPPVRDALERLAATPGTAVFDFDDTIICRDLGDATFETLARSGRLRDPGLGLFPQIDPKYAETPPAPEVWLDRYERLLHALDHQGDDASKALGYAWVVQAMAGRSPAEIVSAAETAWHAGPEGRRYPIPFLYPETADLIGLLLTTGWNVHVISASNPWTVRWAIRDVLNPVLETDWQVRLPPEQVYGLSTALRESDTGRFYTDPHLVGADPGYAALDADVLGRFRLTAQLVPPLPTYTGKVAAALARIPDGRIDLAAGDSYNDLPMLRHARRRLWMARLDRPAVQERLADDLTAEERPTWFIQPTLGGDTPGFIANPAAVPDDAVRGARCWF